MRDIKDIRLDINRVDSKLKDLFLERMEYVDQVREYKAATNTPVKNKGREADILKSKLEGIDNFVEETKEFFKSMIEISCNYQYEHLSGLTYDDLFSEISDEDFFKNVKTVYHQGIKHSYSYEVANKYFSDKTIVSVDSFEEVFDSVINGKCDIGILPLENLSYGCVYDVYDLLKKNNVYITHCVELPIKHCIAGCGNFCDVKTVLSHSQALGQCKKYITEHAFERRECSNTAVAAKYVYESKDDSLAAICSSECANMCGLNIFDENISDINNNRTRFIFISAKPLRVVQADKVSIVFTAKHESGSLARILNNFAMNDINLSKIESRPSQDDEWEYIFYIDLDMPDFDVMEYFSKIRYMFEDFKIMGIYKALRW